MKPFNVALCAMTDAVDGPAIAYWAEARNVKTDGDHSVTSFEVRDGGYEGPREKEEWTVINETKVRAAAKAMREGETDCHRSIQAQFVGKDWDYDSTGIDCLIQHIVFGKIIFG